MQNKATTNSTRAFLEARISFMARKTESQLSFNLGGPGVNPNIAILLVILQKSFLFLKGGHWVPGKNKGFTKKCII